MQHLGLVLILLNIGAIAVPITGVVLIYSNDLSQIFIPSEVEDVVSNTIGTEESIELPQYVSSSYDPSSRTAHVTFSFTNPFDFDLNLNTVSANIVCLDHNLALGSAALNNQITIEKEETQEIIINFVWTQAAETHFLSQHVSESVVDVKLVDMKLDVSGINIEVPEEIIVSVPIIS
jgi:hypothetical protein